MIKERMHDWGNEDNEMMQRKGEWVKDKIKTRYKKKRERELSSLSNKGPCMIPSGYIHTHTLLLSDSVTTATEQRVNRRSNCPSTCHAWEC